MIKRVENQQPTTTPPKKTMLARLRSGLISIITLRGVRAYFAGRKAKQAAIKNIQKNYPTLATLYRSILESLTSKEVIALAEIPGLPKFFGWMYQCGLSPKDARQLVKEIANDETWDNAIGKLPEILEFQKKIGPERLTTDEVWTLLIELKDEPKLTLEYSKGSSSMVLRSLGYKLLAPTRDLPQKAKTEVSPQVHAIIKDLPFMPEVYAIHENSGDTKHLYTRLEEISKSDSWQQLIKKLPLMHRCEALLGRTLPPNEIWTTLEGLEQLTNVTEVLEHLELLVTLLERKESATDLIAELKNIEPLKGLMENFEKLLL